MHGTTALLGWHDMLVVTSIVVVHSLIVICKMVDLFSPLEAYMMLSVPWKLILMEVAFRWVPAQGASTSESPLSPTSAGYKPLEGQSARSTPLKKTNSPFPEAINCQWLQPQLEVGLCAQLSCPCWHSAVEICSFTPFLSFQTVLDIWVCDSLYMNKHFDDHSPMFLLKHIAILSGDSPVGKGCKFPLVK